MEDIEGDGLHNITTFPLKYGIIITSQLIYGLIIAVIIVSILPFYLNIYKVEYFIIIMITYLSWKTPYLKYFKVFSFTSPLIYGAL